MNPHRINVRPVSRATPFPPIGGIRLSPVLPDDLLEKQAEINTIIAELEEEEKRLRQAIAFLENAIQQVNHE